MGIRAMLALQATTADVKTLQLLQGLRPGDWKVHRERSHRPVRRAKHLHIRFSKSARAYRFLRFSQQWPVANPAPFSGPEQARLFGLQLLRQHGFADGVQVLQTCRPDLPGREQMDSRADVAMQPKQRAVELRS